MKLNRYLLKSACLGVLGFGLVFGAYSGDDPEIAKLKDEIKKLQGEINEMKERDDKLEKKSKSLEDELNEKSAEIMKTTNFLKNDVEEVRKNSKKVTALEKAQKDSVNASAEIDKLNKKIKSLEDNVKKKSTKKSDNKETASKEKQQSEEISEMKQAIEFLHEGLEEQDKLNKQQALEMAKNAAEIDKLKKQSINASSKSSSFGSLIGGVAKAGLGILSSQLGSDGSSDLFGSVLKGGLNLLSKTLNPNAVKDAVNNGTSTDKITKDMNAEEKAEFQAITKDIQNGKSDREIQVALDALKEKMANRKTQEAIAEIEKTKFQKLSFFGLNEAFSSPRVSETVTKIYDLSEGTPEAPRAQDILSETTNSIDQEVIDAIHKMVSQGASLKDIFDCISFHTEGTPMKVERKDATKDPVVNSLIKIASDTLSQYDDKPHQGQNTQPHHSDISQNTPSSTSDKQEYNDHDNYDNVQPRRNNATQTQRSN